jgi:hypothetical protein
MRHALIALAILAALASTSANAETIYRCGHEYTSVACSEARPLVVASAPGAEQRADAREVARREKALAAEMVRDRRTREADLKPALAGSLSGPRVAAAAPSAAVKKHAKKRKRNAAPEDERDFIATVPKAKKAAS